MRSTLTCLFFLFSFSLLAQNFLPNGDFENYVFCPHGMQTIQDGSCTDWFQPVKDNTPDYFNTCATIAASTIPSNTMGYQQASSGNGYIGIWAYVPVFDYHEFIACMLKSPLEKGKQYKIRYNISLSNNSCYSLRGLGCAFCSFYPRMETSWEMTLLPHMQYKADKQLSDTAAWMPIEFTYTANGTELYFILGNWDMANTGAEKLPYKPAKIPVWHGAYYYIDDVRCEEIKPQQDSIIPPVVAAPVPTLKDSLHEKYAAAFNGGYVLTRVFFDVDKYNLKPESYPSLDSVVLLLQQYPGMRIEISGHTDSTATEPYNQVLSQHRAEEVRKYFISKGIDPGRMIAVGYASSRPLATNKTVEGRSRNRRVEFRVLEIE